MKILDEKIRKHINFTLNLFPNFIIKKYVLFGESRKNTSNFFFEAFLIAFRMTGSVFNSFGHAFLLTGYKTRLVVAFHGRYMVGKRL